MIRMTNIFAYSVIDPGTGSIDPRGKPDSRFTNGLPARMSGTIEIEFDRDDAEELLALIQKLGGRI